MERRLAAVMIADVAGYGHLSQVDEEGTRARFQADLHDIFEPNLLASGSGTNSPPAAARASSWAATRRSATMFETGSWW
jgi:hypothetical protein